ncbi:MAG: hypothetical protein KatS3mg060_3108 [Dehalococcoidia bacterium]|nr:MAG: hypothetical protein KatS3mg060_3108 [Dehalococcoidia bacterium]
MEAEPRPYGIRWARLGLIVGLLIVLNVAALLFAAIEAPFGLAGSDLVGVVISVPPPTGAPPPPPGAPPQAVGRDTRGQPPPVGVRGIVFSPDGRNGWQFPRRPEERGRSPGGPPEPPQTVVRPLAVPRVGLDGSTLYLATLAAVVGSGFALLVFIPDRVARLSAALSGGPLRLARLAAIGIVASIGAAALTLLLVLIVTGLPLAAALLLALSVATMLGAVAVAVTIGGRLLSWARVRQRRAVNDFLVGMLLLAPLAALPVVGWLLTFAIAALGLGAVVMTRVGADNPFAPAVGQTV